MVFTIRIFVFPYLLISKKFLSSFTLYKMKNIFLLLLLSVVILSSCSDKATPNEPTDSGAILLPTTISSFWINTNVEVTPSPQDSVIESSRTNDSVVVTANGMYQGRQASTQITFENGMPTDTSYYSQNATELYSYSAGVQTDFFSIPRGWLKVADYNASSWKPFPDTTLVNTAASLGGINAVLNGTVKATSTKGGTSTISVAGTSYTATLFTTTIAVNLMAKPEGIPLDAPIVFNLVTKVYHVKGVGVVSSAIEGFTLQLPLIGAFPSNGSTSTLLRFKIAS